MFPSVAVFAILMSSVLLLDASCAFAYVICLLLAWWGGHKQVSPS